MDFKKICENCSESCCSYKEDELKYPPTFTKEEIEKIEKELGIKNCFKPNKNKKYIYCLPLKALAKWGS